MSRSLADIRREYFSEPLRRADLDDDPIGQFNKWMEQALNAGLQDPTAASLATVSADGAPSGRIVLVKHVDAEGFVFFTNYESRKARELAGNDRASLVLYWGELHRQVCIGGRAEKVDRAMSEQYFASRPRGSQLGAWASIQSEPVSDREALDRRVAEFEARFAGGDVPAPPHWGGYRIRPETIEFWQGRESRLHDRFEYRRQGDGTWTCRRLWP